MNTQPFIVSVELVLFAVVFDTLCFIMIVYALVWNGYGWIYYSDTDIEEKAPDFHTTETVKVSELKET